MRRWLLVAVVLLAAAVAWVVWRNSSDIAIRDDPPLDRSAQALQRGAYLVRAGNCMHCHTAPGGAAWAGGRELPTPFGSLYAPNLTPDRQHGIGSWNADAFWRALHEGRAADGRLLYPAFPYTSYTRVTRADSDAMFAYLQSLPAVAQPNRPADLRWPYNQQAALAVWRALFFSPGEHKPQAQRGPEYDRGAYLVTGLGHCADCHSPRNAWGASRHTALMPGGMIPMRNWYAPSLSDPRQAGVQDWPLTDIVALLASGQSSRGTVAGPMREVVQHSTQYLTPADLHAMATYLKAIPVEAAPPAPQAPASSKDRLTRGATLYQVHCVQCHGASGQGVPGAYPPLAGNRAVLMDNVSNLVEQTLRGGFAPSTAANPRPFGMPPFMTVLNDAEVADVLSHVRNSWGNQAAPVTEFDVKQVRAGKAQR
ncbi:alcohol dehydrogenase [Comamonas serinivorans]|uniref:Alcohol dehydrogenase n=1 Tax=Comamonas serinivorans TaxID=1082851 RepID=A0A1Y0ENW2_9BURK|nr:cytochrome c [Comamonas serinivorans]ARU05009.1 alcohol dehydrogenase [Comamonas serinivorans]